eukprot:scaffold104284_cov64-Attheya_sp.AAC.5
MAIDELNTLLLPLVGRLNKAKEARPNRDEDWLWWFPIIAVASGHSGVVGINLGAWARGPRAAESNEFQGWCGGELRQAYKKRFLSFEFLWHLVITTSLVAAN